MRKTVLTYSLIGGSIMTLMMLIVTAFANDIGYDKGLYLGYATLIAGFTMVFFGIRTYRQQHGNTITFGRAFLVGLYITLIASVIYVIAWMVVYHFFMPNFYEDYAAYVKQSMIAKGASQAELTAAAQEFAQMKEMMKNPIVLALFTLIEPLPVGLGVTLLSALILKKKPAVTGA